MIKTGSEPIPGYRIEERLGSGQFGEVWRARSPGDTQLALKFLQLTGAHGWKEFRAVQRVKQIRHPHLMPILAIWLLDDEGEVIGDDVIETIAKGIDQTDSPASSSKATLVAEPITQSRRPAQMIIANLLANQTVGDRLKECQSEGLTGIPATELLRYMEEAAKGLDFLNSTLHQIGDSQGSVQHCDVKPDNIMLSGGSAIVADFGVAQMMAETTHGATATSLGGTPAYMAPECFQNKTSQTTDQYALAVTYYELRTGQLPFAEHTYAAVYEAHKTGTLDFSAASEREQAVLRKATSPDPERRFASCFEFVTRLKAAVAPETMAAPPPRLWRTIATVAASVACLVGGLFWAFGGGSSGQDLDVVIQGVRGGEYGSAAAFVQNAGADSRSVEAILIAIDQQLESDKDKSLEDNDIAKLVTLLSHLRQSGLAKEHVSHRVDDVAQRVAGQFDKRLLDIRNLCDAWAPEEGQLGDNKDLNDRIERLGVLLDPGASGKRLAECERYWSALQVERVRMEARSGSRSQADLLQDLSDLGAIGDAVEGAYAAALRFIFDSEAKLRSIEGKPDAEKCNEIARQLEAYEAVARAFGHGSPAAWENRRIDAQLDALDDAINVEWMDSHPNLREVVGRIVKLTKSAAATNPTAWKLELAVRHRRAQEFGDARRLLEGVSQNADEELADRVQTERLILDLVDPATPASAIHLQLSTADFPLWTKAAKQIQDEYKLRSAAAVDSSRIDPVRAALVHMLRAECALSGSGNLTAFVDGEFDGWGSLLAGGEFEAYARYVNALILARRAKSPTESIDPARAWSEASADLQRAYVELPGDSLLAAPHRTKRAGAILSNAVGFWCDNQPPSDRDFGKTDIFGRRAREAYDNFKLERLLTGLKPIKNAMLLSAAVAAWGPKQDADAAELLKVADQLLAESNSAIRQLEGTIYCARYRAQSRLGTPPGSVLQSAVESLRRLYLSERLAASGATSLDATQLARLKKDLVDPMAPIAERLGTERGRLPVGSERAAVLGEFYQAAGLLLREESVAQSVRMRLQNPDELSFSYLDQANAILKNATTLIAQGRALVEISESRENWRELLNSLAERAVRAAREEKTPVVLGRAYALESFARVMRSRDELRATTDRIKDLEEALALINDALQTASTDSKNEPDYADWLVTRATVNVEGAKFLNLSFEERQARLSSACDDAETATDCESRQHPEFAYLAWGNALEDLAFYLCIDPEKNFKAACDCFQLALMLSKPEDQVAFEYAPHLPSLRSLLRCRQRWADSHALGSESEEGSFLKDAIDKTLADMPSLNPNEPLQDGLSPKVGVEVAELSYFLSVAYQACSIRAPEAEQPELNQKANKYLARAVELARQAKAWAAWADYQSVVANNQRAAGDVDAAVGTCREILDADAQLPADVLYNVITLLSSCDKDRKWTDAEWDSMIRMIPWSASASGQYHARIRMWRLRMQGSWPEGEFREIEALVSELSDDDASLAHLADLRFEWLICRADHAGHHAAIARESNNREEVLRQLHASAAFRKEAIALLDESLPRDVKTTLDQLKQAEMTWTSPEMLPRWVWSKLRTHLKTTHQARWIFARAVFTLIANRGDATDLKAAGQESLRVLDPNIAKEYQDANAATQWIAEYNGLVKVLFQK